MKTKQLIIMRHGKSQSNNIDFDDYMYCLHPEGEKKVKLTAEKFRKMNFIPQLIISSSAMRAAQTSKIVSKELNIANNKIIYDKNLYFNGLDSYFNAVFCIDNNIDSMMIVGHNPLISLFVNHFTINNINMSAGDALVVEFYTNTWTDISQCQHKIVFSTMESEI